MIQELISCYCPIFCKIQIFKVNKNTLQKQANPTSRKKNPTPKPKNREDIFLGLIVAVYLP